MNTLVPLSAIACSEIERLLDAAFGSDRHSRTAYKLRQNLNPISALSLAIVETELLVGSIQCWPICIKTESQEDAQLIMVGPVAVAPDRQNLGFGKRLMAACLAAADVGHQPPLMMIGDPEYYGQFGFTANATAGWRLPGESEPRRLLLRNISNRRLPATGLLAPDYQYAL
jgi:predicted N-acetyltransferase YhbS